MSSLLMTLGLMLAAPQETQQDWPQFLGPHGTGTTELEAPGFEWGEAGPEILWRTEVGAGYGGVAVQGGEVFLLDREAGEADILRALDLKTGADLWEQAYSAEGRLSFPGSRSVPTVTEEHVYSMGGFGDVVCYSRKDQSILWHVNLAEVYEGILPDFGWSNSPLLVGDRLIVTALGEEVGLVALDAKSGEELWVTPPVGISHSTPVVLNLLGRDHLLFLSSEIEERNLNQAGELTISSIDMETGEFVFQDKVLGTPYPIPRPIKIDDERFFVSGGYSGGSSMLKLKKKGSSFEVEELYHMEGGSQLHSPILFEDHLYFMINENSNHARNRRKTGGMLCMTLDGEVLWRTGDDPFFGRGNWILAAGHLFIQDGFNGTLTICEASPEEFLPVAESNLFNITDRKDREMWAPMAMVNGLLLIRSQEELLCVNVRKPAE